MARSPLSSPDSIVGVTAGMAIEAKEEKQEVHGKKYKAFVEPLLAEQENRFVLFPIQHNDVWEMYKKHEACSVSSTGHLLFACS